MKKAVGVAIGTLAFVIAGAAVYGVFSLNETIQAKPDQIQVSNYCRDWFIKTTNQFNKQ